MNNTTRVTIDFLLESAPVDWERAADGWKTELIEHLPEPAARPAMSDAIRELDAVIVQATRLRGYLDGRYGAGCGDQGHPASVKTSNALVARVRKALGFTQARNDVRF